MRAGHICRILLRYVLNLTRPEFYSDLNRKLTEKEIKDYEKLIERRKKHEPVYQIVGKVEFWGLDFYINGDVLVPRPETEFLVQEVLKEIKREKGKEQNILDVGTGAGPIIIALASEIKDGHFYGSDVSKEALVIAKKNAKAQ